MQLYRSMYVPYSTIIEMQQCKIYQTNAFAVPLMHVGVYACIYIYTYIYIYIHVHVHAPISFLLSLFFYIYIYLCTIHDIYWVSRQLRGILTTKLRPKTGIIFFAHESSKCGNAPCKVLTEAYLPRTYPVPTPYLPVPTPNRDCLQNSKCR